MAAPAEHPTATEADADADPAVPGTAVEFAAVSKRFDRTTALDAVDLRVASGEVVVLVGRSGSGKSTLLRLVNGLHPPTDGSITVLGTRVETASKGELRALRRRVGFVFQQFHLVGRLSVLENVCTGALARLRVPRIGVTTYPRSLRRVALDHLERVGMAEFAFQRADTLSGGQQQRVAIARALMQEPEILLADEPVASLDPESTAQVMRLLGEISDERGLTVVCSLHQVELALGWGDRIVGLRDGAVVLDTPRQGLGRDDVMAVYRRVGAADPVAMAVDPDVLALPGGAG